jgi:hypothetical protein
MTATLRTPSARATPKTSLSGVLPMGATTKAASSAPANGADRRAAARRQMGAG